MGLFNLFKPAQTVLVVDVVALNESLGMKGKVPPRNQLQILRRLARFSQREKIKVVAVLTGSPLIKAPAGKKFEDVVVLYSKAPEQHAKFLAKLAGSKGAGGILVSGNAAAEKLAGNAVKKMHMSTFRKAFDLGGDGEGGERGENRTRGNNRPQRRRPQKPTNGNKKSGNEKSGDEKSGNEKGENRPPRQERQPKQNSESDAINELIDLVD